MDNQFIAHQEGETFVIYDASLAEKKPEEKSLKEKRLRVITKKRLGLLSLVFCFIGFIVFLSPIFTAEIKYRLDQRRFKESLLKMEEKEKGLSGFGLLLWLDEKGVYSPENWDFSLIIPEIQLNAKVESSIDPGNKPEYEKALESGVAHAQGTALPDQKGTVYIFGHSTDYPWNISRYHAFFYPLKYLEEGKEIIVIYQGQHYLYSVVEKKVVEANDLEYLMSQDGEKRLVLQTCWPPGTTWKRLIVIAKPIKET